MHEQKPILAIIKTIMTMKTPKAIAALRPSESDGSPQCPIPQKFLRRQRPSMHSVSYLQSSLSFKPNLLDDGDT